MGTEYEGGLRGGGRFTQVEAFPDHDDVPCGPGALALWLAMSALSGLPGPFASPESGHRPQPPVGREIVVEPGPDDSASQASPARHGA